MADAARPTPQAILAPARHPWNLPRLAELPKLTDLTLASVIGGGGGTGGGGSTVFTLLLAVLSLAVLPSCYSDRTMTPSDAAMPAAVTAVSCTADVPAKVVFCGGPMNAPDEIIGGQGTQVTLRSDNVDYSGTDFTFDVQIQNIGAQSLGTDGTAPTGIRVFFETAPVATNGSGTIILMGDSSGTFTGAGQSYYVWPDSLAVHDTSAWVPWHFSVPGTVISFTFQVLVSSQVPDHGGILAWQQVSTLGTFRYEDVAWSGGNDAMAVGLGGQSKRWDGTTWTNLTPMTNTDLQAVAPVSPGVYLAVGESGKIFRFAGKAWTQLYQSAGGQTLRNVWVRDADSWYIVGDAATIISYEAGVWSEDSFPGGGDLSLVAGTLDNDDSTIVATNGGEFYLSLSGGAWAPATNIVTAYLGAIAFDAAGNFFVSTLDGGTFDGSIIRMGTTTEVVSTVGLHIATELIPFDHDSMIASFYDATNSGTTYLEKLRYGAVPLSSTPAALPEINGAFNVTKLDAAGTKFAAICGGACLYTIDVTLGGAWSRVDDIASGIFAASWGRGDSVWVGDTAGGLWKIVDGVATPLTGIPGTRDMWGFSGDELYIAADSFIYRGDGVGPWTLETQLSPANGFQYFFKIWGDPVSGTLIATSFNGRYMQRVGGVWSEPAPAGAVIEGIWGCSASQVWIVSGSGSGTIFNWSPGGLTPDPAYLGGTPLRAITGTGCNDVWAGGPAGQLFHWNGTTWGYAPIAGPAIFVLDLAPRGVDAVYVGGGQSGFATVNAAGVSSRLDVGNNYLEDINSLWTLDNGSLIVGSERSVIIGHR